MKNKLIILILLLFSLLILSSGAVVAVDVDNQTLGHDMNYASINADENSDNYQNQINVINDIVSENQNALNVSKTIVVDGSAENQMDNPTIQTAIDNANPGDTILITGKNYVHTHLIVNKQLTIKSEIGTTMSTCPMNTKGSGGYGIFYIAPEAAGTVIEGFVLNSNVSIGLGEFTYGIMVNASDVKIINCVCESPQGDGILIKYSNNTVIDNVTGQKSKSGIAIYNSTNTIVKNSSFIRNTESGVHIGLDNKNTTVEKNNISKNNMIGIIVDSSDNLNILANEIISNSNMPDDYQSANDGCGIWVNNNFINLNIKGNFFKQNGNYGIVNDYTVGYGMNSTELQKVMLLEKIDQNYFLEHKVQVIIHYNDVARTEGTLIYLGNSLFGGNSQMCGSIKYLYSKTNEGYSPVYYNLKLSEIKQVSPGLYQLELLTPNKKVATYVGAVHVYFYLNKNSSWPEPLEGDVYQEVIFENGVATVDFRGYDFNKTGNVITAVITGALDSLGSDGLATSLKINDTDIPGKNSKTVITASNMQTTPYSGKDLLITLSDIDGNRLFNQIITVQLNGKNYSQVTDDNGQIKIPISLGAGTYGVIINYAGTNYYNKSSKSIKVIVKKTNTNLLAKNVYYAPKSNKAYTVILKDTNNKVLANKTVKFTLNGKTYTRVTNSKGQASLNINLVYKKAYKVYIKFAGNAYYNGVSTTKTITIKKLSTKIIASSMYCAPKSGKSYTITLKDYNNDLLKGKIIKITLNGKTYTKKTNSNGQVTLKISLPTKSYYTKIKFAGTSQYLASSKTTKIVVKKLSTKIIGKNIITYPNSKKVYVVTLKDYNNDLLKGKVIKISFDGKTYTKKTDNKGQANITLNVAKPSVKTLKATFAGTSQYLKSYKYYTITVKKINTKILADDMNVEIYSLNNLTGSLKDANNNLLANKTIKISLDGADYVKTTDSQGIFTLPINLTVAKNYTAVIKFQGDSIYNESTKTIQIVADKINTNIVAPAVSIQFLGYKDFIATLFDNKHNPLANKSVTVTINNRNYTGLTNENGQITVQGSFTSKKDYTVLITFDGDDVYNKSSRTSIIRYGLDEVCVLITEDLSNEDIQDVLDNSPLTLVKFIGTNYDNISLVINKPLTITTSKSTVLNGKNGSSVFTIINTNSVNISNFIINPDSGYGIIVENGSNIELTNNLITNQLEDSKIEEYNNGSTPLPGYGIAIDASELITVKNNNISYFESGIYALNSNNLVIDSNKLFKNNYGIKYGLNVTNTEIKNNNISDNIGWLTLEMPEGPNGYGIYLNQSAINVTINKNQIINNYLGISIDCNNSTGIVITQNWISDSVTEGIRFNAGYDLAIDAIEPIVENNAIYRNAKGPSMFILGEVSANPNGIYGPGEFNESLRLKLGPNWYGANSPTTWNLSSNNTGIGTICPRINTIPISFGNITYIEDGKYNISFYTVGGVFDSNLAEFEMYATLNYGQANATEKVVRIVNGTGIISFSPSEYELENNTISISVGSLDKTKDRRYYSVLYSYNIPQEEIPLEL